MHAPSLKGIAAPPKCVVPEPVNGIPLSLVYHQNADFSSTGDLQRMMIRKRRSSIFFSFHNNHEGLPLTRTANCEKSDHAKKGIAIKT
jgi:hypothetical protein